MWGEGRIYQRGDIFFIAYSCHGREFRESARSRRIEDAQRLLELRLRDREAAQAAVLREPTGLTFDDVADAYLDEYRLREYRSLPAAQTRVERLRRVFGGMPAAGITIGLVTRYQATRRAAGAAAASVNREVASLHRMFTLAVRAGRLASVPVFPMRLRENPPRQGFFEHAQYRAIRAHLPPPYQDVLDFAYLSGWRRREITELTWAEVDLPGGVIRLDPARSKNSSGRLLPLTPPLRAVLKRREKRRVADDPHVFLKDGVTERDWKKAWPQACEAAGLRGRYLHDCRRTAARNLVRAGVPERIAMSLLGHKTRCMFDRYNIVSERDLHQASARLSKYLRQQHAS